MLDPHTAAWVAEFDLRHPVEDWLAHEIFCLLPLPSPLPLRLRRLASDLTRRSPSLRTLHSLDLLLDDRLATSSSESIAAAYRAVALHCVIDALSVSEDNGSFRAFVDGLFSRVAYLERLGPAILAAEPLRELRMEIEPAAGSGLVRASLLQRERDTRQEALDATRVYLKSATEELGPPFLELTADIVVRNGIELGGTSGEAFTEMGEKDEDSGIRSGVAESTFGLSDAVLDHGVKEEVILLETDTEISSTAVDHSVNLEVVFFETNQQLSSLSRDTLDKDMEDDIDREQDAAMQLGKPSDKFDALLTPEVEKVANALKSSCTDLYQVVVDPLQDAIMQADEILKSRLVEMTNGMEQQEIQHQVGARRLVSAVEKGAKENSADETMEQSRKNDSPDVDGTTEQSRKNALHLNRESSVEKQMDEITNRSRSTCRDQ